MKAEGTAEDPDAKHVWKSCLKPRTIDVVELITPEVSGYKHITWHPANKCPYGGSCCLPWSLWISLSIAAL